MTTHVRSSIKGIILNQEASSDQVHVQMKSGSHTPIKIFKNLSKVSYHDL